MFLPLVVPLLLANCSSCLPSAWKTCERCSTCCCSGRSCSAMRPACSASSVCSGEGSFTSGKSVGGGLRGLALVRCGTSALVAASPAAPLASPAAAATVLAQRGGGVGLGSGSS